MEMWNIFGMKAIRNQAEDNLDLETSFKSCIFFLKKKKQNTKNKKSIRKILVYWRMTKVIKISVYSK